jgi:hypothetical protein
MERQPPRMIRTRAVFPIADDWMAEGSQLNPDLVLASGFERKREQRFVPMSAQYAIMCDLQLATLIDTMNHE